MNRKTRILIVEHDPNDIELIKYELKKGGLDFSFEIVQDENAYSNALRDFIPDIILCDYSLPSFSGLMAFKIREERAHDTPFIFVSGSIGEENSIELIKNGVTDYALKDKLFTLAIKVLRALKDSTEAKNKSKKEQERIHSEKRLARAQQLAHMGSWELGFETNTLELSYEAGRIFGLPSDQTSLSYESWTSLVHYEDLDFVLNTINKSQETFADASFNHRIIRDDSTIRHIYSESKFEFDLTGQAIGMYGILWDVTERKLAEEQKEFDRNNLNALINNTNDLMWSIDRNFNLITSNIPFNEMVKKVTGKVMAKGSNGLASGFTEGKLKSYREFYERAFKGESFTEVQFTAKPYELWTEVSFSPIRKENKVIGTACYSRDITQRKLFERELENNNNELLEIKGKLEYNEERLKQAQEIAHVGHWELNISTGAVLWSDEACRIYGLPLTDYIQSLESWMSFIHNEDLDDVKKALSLFDINSTDSSFFHRITLKNGEIKYIYTESRYEFDEAKRPIGLYGIFFDITERKAHEMELYNLLNITTEQNIKLQNFAYIISHNIRSHSANISGLVDLIEKTGTEETKSKGFLMLKTSTGMLAETIENLNEIITIQNDVTQKETHVNLYNEIDKVSKIVSAFIFEAHAKLINNLPPEFTVKAVLSYTESILLNIITNALKYRSAERKPEINIDLEETKDYHIVSIRDNGIGIDLKKNGAKMFGLYKTFHNNKDAKGFGLYIAKNQIEAMGGKIEVESTLGMGSIFKVYFKNI